MNKKKGKGKLTLLDSDISDSVRVLMYLIVEAIWHLETLTTGTPTALTLKPFLSFSFSLLTRVKWY